jgi:hypothetical protein
VWHLWLGAERSTVLCQTLKDTDSIIDLGAKEEMRQNNIVKQYVNKFSVGAAVSLIETAVKCTAAFSIHIAANF